jgi:YidC/Oxa1 family membrane protein insertase
MWLIPDVRIELQDIGWGAFVLVAIYATSQLLSTELSATPNMPESQRRIMRLLPLVVVIFVFQFPVPVGLVLYWMTTNLWTCGQQLVMRHRIGLHLADPEEVEKFNQNMAKKGSRTPSKAEQAAAAVAEEVAEPQPSTPRKRRRGMMRREEEPATAEAVDAPEALEAPEPAGAPESEPGPAPEAAAEPEPQPDPEPAATEPARGANGASGNGRSGGTRRQPRPKGAAKGSRPAPSSRSKKKKR